MASQISGAEFKDQLKRGQPKFGVFLNAASPTIAAQFSHSGYDWLLIDMQHSPMEHTTLGHMITAVRNGKAKCMVRVGSYADRHGIQQALDLGAHGILIPYVNYAAELREAVASCLYPTAGSRSVYFPMACTNEDGLLGYTSTANANTIVAFQVETADCIRNIDEIMAVRGVDIAFLGQNDLCLSMGLYDRYVFPQMYASPELEDATGRLIRAANSNGKLLGIFLFGTQRVGEFLTQGFTFIGVGSDLHHALTQAQSNVSNIGEQVALTLGKRWQPQPSALL